LGYSREVVFNDTELAQLYEFYKTVKAERIKQYYNLFYVKKSDIREPELNYEQRLAWSPLREKIDEAAGLTAYAHYFLEYKTHSFCRSHTDNEEEIGKTGVTLVHASDDLMGGDSILYLKYEKDNDYEFDVNWYRDTPEGGEFVPVVARQDEGDTLWYDHNQKHAVGLVESGTRVVLISWYKGA
tara:strand:- start:264 stop:815 length:552 start_codon:yes stop_codon:yes gene_type:complete